MEPQPRRPPPARPPYSPGAIIPGANDALTTEGASPLLWAWILFPLLLLCCCCWLLLLLCRRRRRKRRQEPRYLEATHIDLETILHAQGPEGLSSTRPFQVPPPPLPTDSMVEAAAHGGAQSPSVKQKESVEPMEIEEIDLTVPRRVLSTVYAGTTMTSPGRRRHRSSLFTGFGRVRSMLSGGPRTPHVASTAGAEVAGLESAASTPCNTSFE